MIGVTPPMINLFIPLLLIFQSYAHAIINIYDFEPYLTTHKHDHLVNTNKLATRDLDIVALQQDEDRNFVSHLEFGASNYGPNLRDPHYHLDASVLDSLLGKPLKVLHVVAEELIRTNPKATNFVLYLNDSNQEGLQIAAQNLKNYLEKSELSRDRNLDIVKIPGDMFTLKKWPRVFTAHLIHPFDVFLYRVLSPLLPISGNINVNETAKIAKFFHTAVAISQSGIYVKESNYAGGVGDFLEAQISKGFTIDGLYFKQENQIFSQMTYVFPDGYEQEGSQVSYRVTQALSPESLF